MTEKVKVRVYGDEIKAAEEGVCPHGRGREHFAANVTFAGRLAVCYCCGSVFGSFVPLTVPEFCYTCIPKEKRDDRS